MNEDTAATEQVTCCPHCDTSFRISEEQLAMASGAVRCGSCLTIFQAEEHLLPPSADECAEVTEEDVIYLGYEGIDDQSVEAPSPEDPIVVASDENDPPAPQADENHALHADYWNHFEAYVVNHLSDPSVSLSYATESASPLIEAQQEPVDQANSSETFNSVQEWDPGETPGTTGARHSENVLHGEGQLMASAIDAASRVTPGIGEDGAVSSQDVAGHDNNDPSSGELEQQEPTDAVNAEIEPTPVIELNLVEDTDPETLIGEYRVPPKMSRLWVSAAVLMLFVGASQVAWFNLDQIAGDVRYRAYTIEFCRYLGCTLSDYSDAGTLKTSNLLIRTHPEVASALIVDAIVRNSAAFRQRFPGIRLRFQDPAGTTIASRTFQASDYLAGELRGLRYIPANTEVRFALEIADPGNNAVGYDMAVVINQGGGFF